VRWLRPRSIRARVTLGAVVMVFAIVGVGFMLITFLIREVLFFQVEERASEAARNVVEHITEQRYAGDIPESEGVLRMQVIDQETHEVLVSSDVLHGYPALTDARPDARDSRVKDTVCGSLAGPHPDQCLLVVGYAAEGTAYGDVTVLAAIRSPQLLQAGVLEAGMVAIALTIMGTTAAVIWYGVGRALRPVELISAEMERITGSNLHRRVPVPKSDDEIAHLAHAANAGLARIEEAVTRQRRFVADASHELRNPITGMLTKLEVELSDPDPDMQERERVLNTLFSDTERLNNIVTDLLELARVESDVAEEREPVDMCVLLEEEFSGERRRITPYVHGCDNAWVTGSRVRLTRVLTNLVTNAERHAKSRIEVVVARKEDVVVIEVHDDGAGIPESERERIFERFSRLDESMERDPEGSGLGLAISREIAQAKGGTLKAGHSGLLGGAVFILTLPAAQRITG